MHHIVDDFRQTKVSKPHRGGLDGQTLYRGETFTEEALENLPVQCSQTRKRKDAFAHGSR